MNWTSGIQAALDYIEEHLTDELDINAIAAQAACSGFYFQRIFGILCGLTLGEYIRYRRMTCAGEELSAGGAKVIDVALKYGYDSPESFSRAFMRFHGITPSEAKKCPAGLRSFSPLSVQGFRLNRIPARSWAEFSCTGAMPQAIQRLWHQICGEFFPASGWQPTFEYDIEIYPKGDMSSEAYKSGIRVAVHRGMN